MKVCCTCKLEKPYDLFPKNKSEKDGFKKRCKECNNRANKEYRQRNPESSAASSRNWAMRNPEKVLAKKKRWEEKNPGRMDFLVRRWAENNQERLVETRRQWVSRPENRLHRALRERIRQTIITKRENTFNILGYTRAQLISHLEKQFQDGMTWDNYGEWHVDHIIPLVSFGIDGPDHPDIRSAWCLSNLRPLWAADNIKKKDKICFLL